MKNLAVLLFVFFLSCKPQKLDVTQEISDEKVTFFRHYEYRHPDSINITLPTEYKFNVKPKDIGKPPIIYYSKNNILQSRTTDYFIYNKKSMNRIYNGLDEDIPINLLIVAGNFCISKKEAQDILNKYKIKGDVYTLNYGDSITVAPYSKIRKDFPWIVERLNKVPDSIAFNFTKDHFLGKKVRIKW